MQEPADIELFLDQQLLESISIAIMHCKEQNDRTVIEQQACRQDEPENEAI